MRKQEWAANRAESLYPDGAPVASRSTRTSSATDQEWAAKRAESQYPTGTTPTSESSQYDSERRAALNRAMRDAVNRSAAMLKEELRVSRLTQVQKAAESSRDSDIATRGFVAVWLEESKQRVKC